MPRLTGAGHGVRRSHQTNEAGNFRTLDNAAQWQAPDYRVVQTGRPICVSLQSDARREPLPAAPNIPSAHGRPQRLAGDPDKREQSITPGIGQAVRIVDMSTSNSWAEFADLFRTTRQAFLDHERAKGELKALMPEDAKEAIGHGVRARRSKSGAVSFDLLEAEGSHAAV